MNNTTPALQLRYHITSCALGKILAASLPEGLCAVLLGDDDTTLIAELGSRFPLHRLAHDADFFRAIMPDLVRLLESPDANFPHPLFPQGTVFQKKVWEQLRLIPAGQTITYSELARRIGQPTATRAVASACGANPLAIVIPCHRVIGSQGQLTGYRWGVERKRELLARESAVLT